MVYSLWWMYLIYFLYFKEYDDNYAGGSASIGLGLITVFIILAYVIGFVVAAVKYQTKRKQHLLTLIILLLPVVVIYLIEANKGNM